MNFSSTKLKKPKKKYDNEETVNVRLLYGLRLWYLTPLSSTFQLYRGRSVLLVEETAVPVLPQVTDKLYHIILY